MALMNACACARAFRVGVAVLVFSAVVGLCQHVLVPERDDSQISQEILGIRTEGREAVHRVSVRSTDADVDVPRATVRSVALKHFVAREDSYPEKLSYGSEEAVPEAEEGSSSSPPSSWRVPDEVADPNRTIGKRMMVPRGRSLRTTKRQPYPCTLPPGTTCPPAQTCCGSACVTITFNSSHCGRCGHMCSLKRECCSGKCRRVATDEKNCGRCGSRCAPGTKCLFGMCGYSS